MSFPPVSYSEVYSAAQAANMAAATPASPTASQPVSFNQHFKAPKPSLQVTVTVQVIVHTTPAEILRAQMLAQHVRLAAAQATAAGPTQ